MAFERSEKLFREAKKLLVGGVNSPVRAYRGMDISPPFIKKAEGAYLWDEDGNRYIDYVGSWGPAILGHAHPKVVAAVREAAVCGLSFGAPTEAESRLAGLIQKCLPSMENIRFVNSGTEATMSAIRVARAFTKRDKIVKFEGCYHGHADFLLVKAGSGLATWGEPSSAGIPAEITKQTISLPYNNLPRVRDLFEKDGREIAAVIVEPVAGNMGCIPPRDGFLAGLRRLCDQYDSLLIFDEVMTGFRISVGGAQGVYDVRPDLTCLGKIIGGGLPVGAYGGRRDIMEMVSPLGSVYQAGTLSGNPLAMAAGIATLEELIKPGIYERLSETTRLLVSGLEKIIRDFKIPAVVNRVGSMWSIFFMDSRFCGNDRACENGNRAPEIYDFTTASLQNQELFKGFFLGMLERGIYLAPSSFESAFVSLAHTEDDIEKTLGTVGKVLNVAA